ncbi:hypothetical protein L249_8585 [Ophiocordyceps polyrhachis-furcata BCC 54312]|uniref:Uncharacterized protein n=1 Tax=Ophiocordyceps polyrhachis-furcata BCC 54312 TaxID=1330021 RepID=A0A367L6B3_9HYPO|nr:hypothetical protein L249_8585 [Ophiocordyceps polyrhachis-furcata BCC 54312]
MYRRTAAAAHQPKKKFSLTYIHYIHVEANERAWDQGTDNNRRHHRIRHKHLLLVGHEGYSPLPASPLAKLFHEKVARGGKACASNQVPNATYNSLKSRGLWLGETKVLVCKYRTGTFQAIGTESSHSPTHRQDFSKAALGLKPGPLPGAVIEIFAPTPTCLPPSASSSPSSFPFPSLTHGELPVTLKWS